MKTVASHTRFRLATTLIVVVACAVWAVCAGTAHAQRVDESLPPLADLTIASEYDSDRTLNIRPYWAVTVKNNAVGAHPGMQVHLVKVEITISEVIESVEIVRSTQIWTIRDLPPGDSATRTVLSWRTIPAVADGPAKAPQRLYAQIIESDPVESPRFEFNNATEHWAMANRREVVVVNSPRAGVNRHTSGDAVVEVPSISDRFPEQGGATTFTVIAYNVGASSFPGLTIIRPDRTLFEVQVEISLSPGLSFAGTQPDPPSGTTFDTTTGIWNVGTLVDVQRGAALSLPVAVNLASDSLADLSLKERCLTAKVVRAVPWFASDPLKRLNDTATACLGNALLDQGEIILFYPYDCVGITASPCTDDDTVEMLARLSTVGQKHEWLQPESVLVHVNDPTGRVRDVHTGSVTSAGPSWQTARDHAQGAHQVKGLKIGYTRAGFNNQIADWSNLVRTVTVSGLDGGAAPGRVKIRFNSSSGNVFFDPNPTHQRAPFQLNTASTAVSNYFLEFSALGTYVVDFKVAAVRSDAGMTTYTDTGTYTFHVGPAADLAVRDAGANPEVAADRRAYTILAANNGPEVIVPAGRVTLTGVPEGAEAVPSQGSYAEGTCQGGLCEGVWTIGKLRPGYDHRPSAYAGEGAALSLIAASGGPITATIENMQNYCVRIKTANPHPENDLECAAGSVPTGYTEHSVAYYDHVEGNNTATIAARAGTGESVPSAPTLVETSKGNILQWGSVDLLYGFEVTHYQVQRFASPWTTMADKVAGTVYVDMDLRPGQLMQYRVRAVNVFGVGGPWSQPTTSGPDAPGDFTAEQLQNGEVRLTWTKPDGNGAAITGYTIQVSTDGGQSWGNTGARLGADDTSWIHSNLSVGPVRLYRIRASTAQGHGPWAQATSASIAAPTLSAYYAGPSEIELTWTMPGGNAVPVLSWELQYSPDGSSWNRLATVQAGDGMAYTDRGLSPGAFRHYRVRASTALGHGPWSEAATATTAAGVPGNFRAQANGPNEIVLTWNKPSGDAEIWEYQVQRKTEGVDWVRLAVVYPEDGTSYVDGGLSPGGTWSYRVRAISIADGNLLEGEWSAEASATTDSAGPANAPTGLTATPNGENRIDLSWTAPAAGGGSVTGYRVEHSTDQMTWERVASLGNVTSYSHTGLMSGTTHYYRVAALSGGNAGPFSNEASATTAGSPTTVPGMPTDLRVTGVDRDRVSIAWGPPADDGGARVTGYEYQYVGPCAANPADLCFSGLRSAGGTSASVSGLTAGEYTFEVRAVNAVGAGPWSDTVWATVVPEARGRVIVTPDSLALTEGGSATYRVKLSHEPIQPIQLGLFWDDPGEDLSLALAGYQGMLLLPSNYAPPEGALWDGWAYPWNVGIPITVEAVEDDDEEDGTVVIFHDVWTAPADLLGNPPDWAEDPVYHFMTGPAVIVAVRDND